MYGVAVCASCTVDGALAVELFASQVTPDAPSAASVPMTATVRRRAVKRAWRRGRLLDWNTRCMNELSDRLQLGLRHSSIGTDGEKRYGGHAKVDPDEGQGSPN